MPGLEENDADHFSSVWPHLANKAFVKAAPFEGAWVANRADERLYRIIKGFHEAGDVLVSESRAEPDRAINLVYPAIFAYRQSLELRLKYIVSEFGGIAGEPPNFRTHDLQALWTKCKHIVASFQNGVQARDEEAFRAADAQIAEFDAIDPGSDAFRFAHDTKGRPVKLALSEVDLGNLRKAMASLHDFLECICYHLRYLEETTFS
jgi:hypothetical protein